MPAPIVVFAYNRPDHLQRTLSALAQNLLADQSDLFIYCDGAKAPDGQAAVDVTRAVAEAVTGFANVTVVKREKNWGLARSIVDGVSAIVQKYGRVIVVEDDILTSPYFLTYMNEALDLYADNPKVACIHGWCFPHNIPNPPDTFFLRGADCWGWATWADKWAVYDPNALELLSRIQTSGLEKEFNLDGAYDYTGMLKNTANGHINSWAIRWHASTFLSDMYCLYPSRSLVKNTGLDNSGEHCSSNGTETQMELAKDPITVTSIPVQNSSVMKSPLQVWSKNVSGNFAKRILRRWFPWLRHLKRRFNRG